MNLTTTPADIDCGGCDNGECCGACTCCPGTAPTATLRWNRERDDYGRSVHHLRDENYRTLGVVVRVPRWTPASILPSPYFITTWDRYTTPDQEPTYAGHHVPSLKAGKALLEEWAR